MRSLHVIVLNNKTNRKNQSLNNLHRQQLAPFNTRQFGIAFPLFLAKEGNHLSESRYFRGGWGRYFRDLLAPMDYLSKVLLLPSCQVSKLLQRSADL